MSSSAAAWPARRARAVCRGRRRARTSSRRGRAGGPGAGCAGRAPGPRRRRRRRRGRRPGAGRARRGGARPGGRARAGGAARAAAASGRCPRRRRRWSGSRVVEGPLERAHISMLPPSPMMSRSGRPRPHRDPQEVPSTRTNVRGSFITGGRSGRGPASERRVGGVAQALAGADRGPERAASHSCQSVPPRSRDLGGALAPLRGGGRQRLGDEVRRLRVVRRVEDGLDVAAVAQHEAAVAAQHLGGPVGAVPRDDVVGVAGDDEGVAGDLAEVDRGCRARRGCPRRGRW